MKLVSLLLLAVFTYLAAVLDTALADALRIGDLAPDLLALVALAWVLSARGPWAFLGAGAVAAVGDLLAPGRLGIGAAVMLLVAYGVNRLVLRWKFEHLVVQTPVVFVAVTLWAAGVGLCGRLLGDVTVPCSTILVRAAGVGLHTAGVGVPVLMVLGWVREPRLRRQKRLAGE